jgi:PAS domain S-box-containing protein
MKIKRTYILIFAFCIGLLFPFLAWVIEISYSDFDFSFSGIRSIHSFNPSLFIADLFPFVLFLIAFIFYDKWTKLYEEYKSVSLSFENQTSNIKNVATFAEKIGNGEYEYEFEMADDNDTLSKTIKNLRDKLYENNKQETMRNWIMVGKDKISNIVRIHNDIYKLSYEVLVDLIKYIQVIQGAFYLFNDNENTLKIIASYAFNRKKYLDTEIKLGESLVGEAAIEQNIIHRTEIPSDYVTITSGILGDKKPQSILIVPLITEEKLQGALEFATLGKFRQVEIDFLKEIAEIIARAIYNLQINERTEHLLKESQQMTRELQENEEKLRQNAEEMRATQEELEKMNKNLQDKIEEVNQSQKRLYSLLENASELILIYDENKKLKYVSPSSQRIVGYSEEEMKSGKDFDRINFKGQQVIDKLFEDLINNPGKSQTVEYTYLHKEGNKIFLETHGRNLLNDSAINGLILNTSDITERKRAEKEQRMRGQMQSLSENSPDMILRVDTNGLIFYNNPMFETYTGLKTDEFNKKNFKELAFFPEIIDAFSSLISEVVKKKEKVNRELDFPTNTDEVKIMNVNAIPEFNEEKRIETILFVLHDITEQKQTELMIRDKNKKITESINYAHRIQECILPNKKIIQKVFKQSFIFYKPKDVVSGDFPYFYTKDDDIYIAVIDCTGHGVPGAMLSMIGYFLLNQILSLPTEYSSGEILNQLHSGVISTLRQDQEGASARDGMDVALCKINLKKNELQFAGAHRPLYLLRNGELLEFKPTKSAIGGIPKDGQETIVFQNYIIPIEPNDAIYFFSDGIVDQFGGPDGTKYFTKRIKNILLETKDLSMPQIYKMFKEDYDNWLGTGKQIDDVLLIGIRF